MMKSLNTDRLLPITVCCGLFLALQACTHTKLSESESPGSNTHTAQEKKLVQNVIRSNINQINLCYERLLSQNPKVQGKVVTEFTVNAGQPPSDIRIVSSDVTNKKLKNCIVEKIQGWNFAEYKNARPLKVTYPFSADFRKL